MWKHGINTRPIVTYTSSHVFIRTVHLVALSGSLYMVHGAYGIFRALFDKIFDFSGVYSILKKQTKPQVYATTFRGSSMAAVLRVK